DTGPVGPCLDIDAVQFDNGDREFSIVLETNGVVTITARDDDGTIQDPVTPGMGPDDACAVAISLEGTPNNGTALAKILAEDGTVYQSVGTDLGDDGVGGNSGTWSDWAAIAIP
ncbi:hypothetical protein ABZ698_39595, partial [Streptomyces antibioticus]